MLVDANPQSAAAVNVTGAIRQAANVTGASFQYLLATAQVESGLNPSARAATSSAGGLFQFIEQTWLGTLKEAGPSLGYGRYADAITRNQSGRYVVSDPAIARTILDLRQDAKANALMAGVFTRSNALKLQATLGRQATDGELYMAHFLGAAGASRLLETAAQNPQARAADLFPYGARANRSIFYDKQGHARSVAQVAQVLSHRYDVAAAAHNVAPIAANAVRPTAPVPPAKIAEVAQIAQVARAAQITQAAKVASGIPAGETGARSVPDPAALARAYEALAREARKTVAPPDTTAAFRALARSDRREPIAPVVVKVWSVHAPKNAPTETFNQRFSAAEPGARLSDGRFNLFEDFAPNVKPLFTGS
ncbi:MAG: transglycosylase SLT domain-containing protein [Rhizobiales bacterium]|nr:transglycosylase SLT domain-containing protein [Hyphomicrobiales bacterium]